MPDTFNTTRTPGSRSSAYDLVDHIAESNPHPQYLLKSDYQGGGSGSLDLEIHKSDPNAHGDNYVKPAALNNYYTKAEIDANFYTKTYIDTNIYTKAQVDELLKEIDVSGVALYHDPANDDSEEHAASMKAANVVYNLITDHITRFSQSASLTNHLDDSGLELYAHRIHKHGFTDLSGVASANHNHDNRYSPLSHNHDDRYALIVHSHNYLSEEDLALVGVYPHTLEGTNNSDSDGTVIPFNFNEETTQGNISLAPDVMLGALNGPSVGNLTSTSFLNVVTNIVSDDMMNDDGTVVYGERNCSQVLYTTDSIHFRIGHRTSGTLAEGEDESSLWTFGGFNTITPTVITDLEARVGVLEANAIMFARHDFTAATGTGGWQQNSAGFYEYTFMTNHFTSSHIYMTESGGSVLVDESVEVHIVGDTASEDIDRNVTLVAPQPFAGYIITLG